MPAINIYFVDWNGNISLKTPKFVFKDRSKVSSYTRLIAMWAVQDYETAMLSNERINKGMQQSSHYTWNAKSFFFSSKNHLDWTRICVKLVRLEEIEPREVKQCIRSHGKLTINDNPINENRWKLSTGAHCAAEKRQLLQAYENFSWWNHFQQKFSVNKVHL